MRRNSGGGYSRPPSDSNYRQQQHSSRYQQHQSNKYESSSGDRGSSSNRRPDYGHSSRAQQPRQLSHEEMMSLEQYRAVLQTLTFNSRPIIENLTAMARDRARLIPGPLSRATLDHLVMAPPTQKTPVLFLVDSICKSVCDPYVHSFVKHGLVSAFVRVFGEVAADPAQRRDMLRVLPTWNGLFPPPVLAELDAKLRPYLQPGEILPPPAAMPAPAPIARPSFSPETFKLLNDLLAVYTNPPGPHVSGIVGEIFKRLSRHVSPQLMNDLDRDARMPDKRGIIARIQKVIATGDPYAQERPVARTPPPQQPQPQPPASPSSVSLPFELPPNFQLDLSLLNSIAEITAKSASTSNQDSPKKKTLSKYQQPVQLTSTDLLKSIPRLHEILYAEMPLQCKNCALRFPDTEDGQSRLTVHLDSHFRRNMRLKERSKRVLARDWFGGEEDWRTERKTNMESDVKVNIFDGAEASESELSSDEFVVSKDGEGFECAICHESISVAWSDDQEAWISKGAQEVESGIVHVSCVSNQRPKRQKKKRDPSAQQVVLYSESEKRLQVRNEDNMQVAVSTPQLASQYCRECGQRLPVKGSPSIKKPSSPEASFIDRNYFRLLDISSKTKELHTVDDQDSDDYIPPKNLSESAFNQGYYRRFFREDAKLGRGSGGSVFKCQHFLDDIELGWYAVKKVPVGDDHSWLNRMLREVHILENLHHPNIIEYKHAWLEYHRLTPFGPSTPCLFILMQLAEGGNLEEAQFADSESICDVFLQILRGLDHLHQCGILHRDLKPSNILLQRQNEGITALITDFGEGVSASHHSVDRTGFTGTIEFVAPELLKQNGGQYTGQHSKATDIWSLGMILYWMLNGRLPYDNIDDIDILRNTICGMKSVYIPRESLKRLPKSFQDALRAMLQIDPEFRPTTSQLLAMIQSGKPIERSVSKSKFAIQKSPTLPQLPPVPELRKLDENSRITLALFIIMISVFPTYPSLPPLNRSILAFAFAIGALKTVKLRSAVILLSVYLIFIASFLYHG